MAGAGGEKRCLTSGQFYTGCKAVADDENGLAFRVKLDRVSTGGEEVRGYLTKSNIDAFLDMVLDDFRIPNPNPTDIVAQTEPKI